MQALQLTRQIVTIDVSPRLSTDYIVATEMYLDETGQCAAWMSVFSGVCVRDRF